MEGWVEEEEEEKVGVCLEKNQFLMATSFMMVPLRGFKIQNERSFRELSEAFDFLVLLSQFALVVLFVNL